MRRRLLAASLCIGFLASPAWADPETPAAPAHREPTAGDLATARTALREGLGLRDKGDLHGAQIRLLSAYDLVPTPVTGFELGKTHMLLGHILQAHELFKKVERMPPSLEESTRSQTARDEASRLAKELEPRVPSLRVKLTLPAGATAVVQLDEETIALTGTETVRAVDPGPHDLVAKAGDGPEQKVHVEVAESETKDVALSPQWVVPKAPRPSQEHNVIFLRQTNPLAFVGFGVAGAAIIVSAVTGVLALNALDDARAACGHDFCPPRSNATGAANLVSDVSFTSDAQRAAGFGLVAGLAAITAVVFLGVGIVGAVKPIRERVTAQVRPGGFGGTF